MPQGPAPALACLTGETAAQKARMAEDTWNSLAPPLVSLAYGHHDANGNRFRSHDVPWLTEPGS